MTDATQTQQSPIATNPSWRPTAKWNASTAAGAVCILSVWLLHTIWPNLTIPTEVGMSFCYLVTQALGYLVPNSGNGNGH